MLNANVKFCHHKGTSSSSSSDDDYGYEEPSFLPRPQSKAPNFKGKAVVNKAFKDIQLSDYKGKWLILFFYPLDL